jgi:hypothetical protein
MPVAGSVTHERQVAAAIAKRGEEIKTHSAEYQWICCGAKPALLPPDKPAIVARNSPGPEAFESAMRKEPRATAAASAYQGLKLGGK